MTNLKIILSLILPLLTMHGCNSFAQTVINNGDHIVVKPGAYIVISNNYINRNDGNSDGIIDLDGTIILGRNWVNEANNRVISNIGTSIMGDVIMNGSINQFIEGTSPTHFENLILRNSDKTLRVTDCEVNGVLTVDAILKLNSNKLIIDNPATGAIDYVSKYILSETTPVEGYGEVQWNIGDKALPYEIPFGSGLSNANDLDLTLTVSASGDAGGAISFATYYAGCHNTPVPDFVQFLDRSYGFIADRYWIIEPLYSSFKPAVDIRFKYTDRDVNKNCNPHLYENKLKAIRYNTLKNTWNDMPPNGTSDEINNILHATGIASDDFFAPWALVNEEMNYEIFIPNAFTPNGDGVNDYFIPQGLNLELCSVDMYIYNRWGEMLYHTSELSNPWNGLNSKTNKPLQEGVYSYLIYVYDIYGVGQKFVGHVTLLP